MVVVRFKPPMSHHSTPLVLMGWVDLLAYYQDGIDGGEQLTKHVKCLHQEQVLRHS